MHTDTLKQETGQHGHDPKKRKKDTRTQHPEKKTYTHTKTGQKTKDSYSSCNDLI